ncbi:MAG TPA: heterodisulfide reductase-related iron-sulfur binding cluster [Ktedonobacteraceae bacterium]|nr:heterodisulfide reductase-related iron-sulfur binding cluster [Ktedonobacteraceae bacterium]
MSSESQSIQTTVATVTSPAQGPLHRHTHTYDLMRQCIHCGFCLPTCPTYAILGVEMDSPRGRIYQMQAVAEGRMEISPEFVNHMYCCLGCRACETACPSGVQFGKLIEAAREQIQLEVAQVPILSDIRREVTETPENEEFPLDYSSVKRHALESPTDRVLRHFFFDLILPSRMLTSLVFAALKIYQRSGLQTLIRRTGLLDFANALPTPLQGQLKTPEELMPSASGDLFPQLLPEVTPALTKKRYRVGFISGCIMDQVYRDINEASIRVLTANGCEVITPPMQQCCGALHVHAGEAKRGRQLARHNIDVFEPYNCDVIIINSAGCGSNLKEYGHLLRDDPAYASRASAFSSKVKDISEFLMSIELNREMGLLNHTITYHDACHLFHGQKVKQQPRELLRAIPGLTILNLKESDWCCGSAGIYNITNQEMASQLLERKMNNILASGANIVITGNPGCMMQIALGARRKGYELAVMHPVQLLDESYQAKGIYEVADRERGSIRKRGRTLVVGIGIAILIGYFISRRRQKEH